MELVFLPGHVPQPLLGRVWTFPAFIVGEEVAAPPIRLDPVDQKSLFNAFAERSFSDVIGAFKKGDPRLDDSELMAKVTSDSREHRSDFSTFEEAFDIESRSFMQELQPEITATYCRLRDDPRSPREFATLGKLSIEEAGRMCGALLYASFKYRTLAWTQFPSAHINGAIHADLRMGNEPCKKGDSYDFAHATEALPYCSYFFTEKKLGMRLGRPRLKLDAYGCRVIGSEDDVVSALRELLTAG